MSPSTPSPAIGPSVGVAAAETITPRLAGQGTRLLHTMLRVRDLDRALAFYVGQLGMTLLRRQDFPEGRFTLAFVGYAPESMAAALELTHNWGEHHYDMGSAFGHVAIEVPDAAQAARALAGSGVSVTRPPGPLKGGDEVIAFVEDPDGYLVELIESRHRHDPVPQPQPQLQPDPLVRPGGPGAA